MDINFFIRSLKTGIKNIEAMLSEITDEQARWKPEPSKWSALEVINHLCDEECNDFRKRLDLTLHHPEQEWPGIDPEGWVSLNNYNQKDLKKSLEKFRSERNKSVEWLRQLSFQKLEQSYNHPTIGSLAAGDLLAAWAAHDYLHVRQLANLEIKYLDTMAKPFSIRYASP